MKKKLVLRVFRAVVGTFLEFATLLHRKKVIKV